MEQLYRILKPLANIYIISLAWLLTILNLYLYLKPLLEHIKSTGLKKMPVVLDTVTYYTSEEGYEILTNLGNDGRHSYQLAKYYSDFILPILFFMSLSLPNLSMGKDSRYVIAPFIHMTADYIENMAERYVLDIYPRRNDLIMTLACYSGVVKVTAFFTSLLFLIINVIKWKLNRKNELKRKTE